MRPSATWTHHCRCDDVRRLGKTEFTDEWALRLFVGLLPVQLNSCLWCDDCYVCLSLWPSVSLWWHGSQVWQSFWQIGIGRDMNGFHVDKIVSLGQRWDLFAVCTPVLKMFLPADHTKKMLHTLPEDVASQILDMLTTRQRARLNIVCSEWNILLRRNWQNIHVAGVTFSRLENLLKWIPELAIYSQQQLQTLQIQSLYPTVWPSKYSCLLHTENILQEDVLLYWAWCDDNACKLLELAPRVPRAIFVPDIPVFVTFT